MSTFRTMSQAVLPHRLCVYCRTLESIEKPCKYQNGTSQGVSGNIVDEDIPVSGLLPEDAELIRTLQEQPSALCGRCSRYDLLKVLNEFQPLDQTQRHDSASYYEDFAKARISLGRPSSLFLTPSCQFCRILYCVVPRRYEPERYDGGGMKSTRMVRTGEPDVYIEPCRSYLRSHGWETLTETAKNQHAVILGLFTGVGTSTLVTDTNFTRSPHLTGPAIALESCFAKPDRTLHNLQPVKDTLDLSLLRQPLDECILNHGSHCHVEKPEELQTTRMIDIVSRTVVPCPKNCDYVALSYVWGGVQPSPGALENRCLPQTIEDAISVTKALGRKFLWVCLGSSLEYFYTC